MALKEQNVAHGRIVIIIEACEESGSPDLPFYVNHLKVLSCSFSVSLLVFAILLAFLN